MNKIHYTDFYFIEQKNSFGFDYNFKWHVYSSSDSFLKIPVIWIFAFIIEQ